VLEFALPGDSAGDGALWHALRYCRGRCALRQSRRNL